MKFLLVLIYFGPLGAFAAQIGSKNFTENYILAEIAAQTLEAHHKKVDRRFGLGATGIAFEALKTGEIDFYPEYTGTIAEAILKNKSIASHQQLNEELAKLGLTTSRGLGFNNTYAIAVKKNLARKYQLKTISDLKKIESMARVAVSYEFMDRHDGYKQLIRHYGLTFSKPVRTLDHSLLYEAFQRDKIDIGEIYSTDPKIERFDLILLEDDKKFFPIYEPVFLARKSYVDQHPEEWAILSGLAGTIHQEEMRFLNMRAEIDKKSFKEIAREHLGSQVIKSNRYTELIKSIIRRTKEHILLVFVAVFLSVLCGIPLGILATRRRWLGQLVLSISGVLQTIPSLAMLCFLIPVLGIGTTPAITALFLYGLLPVVINTYAGIQAIESRYIQTAQSLGLSPLQILIRIEVPLASQSIWAGITTSTIVSVGTATLAALIGAGGYGAPVISGLSLNDMNMVLQGAIPAAVFALLAQASLHWLGKFILPKGL